MLKHLRFLMLAIGVIFLSGIICLVVLEQNVMSHGKNFDLKAAVAESTGGKVIFSTSGCNGRRIFIVCHEKKQFFVEATQIDTVFNLNEMRMQFNHSAKVSSPEIISGATCE